MELHEDSPGLLKLVLASVANYAVVLIDPDARIRVWSPGAERLFGFPREAVLGRSAAMLFTPEDIAQGAFERELAEAVEQERALDLRWLLRADGTRVWTECALTPLRDMQGTLVGYVKIARDATDRKRDEERMQRLARVDALTGLANRSALHEYLARAVDEARREGCSFLVHAIDLDRFKPVNDRHGHAVGDRLLQAVADRISDQLRSVDLLARVGGDEFVVVQSGVIDPSAGSQLASRIVRAMEASFDLDGVIVNVGASIGIAVFPHDSTDPERLLHLADLALYKTKADSRGGYHYFTRDIDRIAHRRSRIQSQLRTAMHLHAFELHYQPQLRLRDNEVVGVEALLRCTHPPLARYPVGDLIAVASHSGFMRELGLWALADACRQAEAWRSAGLPPLRVCVNFCAGELADPHIAALVAQTLDRWSLPPEAMEVEVTEHELFVDAARGRSNVAALRELGISVSIDDFGTGYSSLGRLATLPVDRIKLDRSFVEALPHEANSRTIAEAVVSLAQALHLGIVGEGVETAEQARFLESIGCDTLQGYWVGRPMPADVLTAWLTARTRAKGAGVVAKH